MVEGPCCSNLSCTSAYGMQHLPTHSPFSSSLPFPHQFIQNPAHSPDVSIAQQPAVPQAEGALSQGVGCAFSKLFAVNLILHYPTFIPVRSYLPLSLPLMPSTTLCRGVGSPSEPGQCCRLPWDGCACQGHRAVSP